MKRCISKIINSITNLNMKYDKFITEGKAKKVFQFLPRNIIMLLFFIFTLCFFVPKIATNDVRVYNSTIPKNITGPIIDNPIKASINTKELKHFTGIDIMFGTYMKKNNSIYKLTILKDNKLIYSKKFNAVNIKNDQYNYFKLKKIKIDKNSSYKVVITPIKVAEGKAITAYVGKNNMLVFRLTYKSPWYMVDIIIFIIFLITFGFINYLINNNKIKSEKSFLLLILVYVIPILFLIPALEVPDETYHFYRAYSLSQYNFSLSPNANFTNNYVKVSKNISCLYYADSEGKDNVNNISTLSSCFSSKSFKKYKIPALVGSGAALVYLPSAIAIKLASLFTSSPILLFYLGRIINFIISFLLLYQAFRILPKYKKIFLIVVCIPTFIQQTISYSYDSLLNSCAILLMAYFVKFYVQNEQISKKEFIIYAILSFFMLYIKLPYCVLPLLILLVPKNKFKNSDNKNKFLSIILVGIIIIILYLLINKLFTLGVPFKSKNVSLVTQNPSKQLHYLLRHPVDILKITYMTIRTQGSGYITSLIGNFGWLKFPLDFRFVFMYYIVMIIIILSSTNIIKNIKSRVCIFVMVIFVVAAICGGMYLEWTDYRLPYVIGVQGRYFIPLLIPLFLALIPKKAKLNIKNETIYTFINIVFIIFIVSILVNYY
jgi:uncharacterized membrane protein